MYNFSNITTELSNDKLMIDLHLCGSDVHNLVIYVFYSLFIEECVVSFDVAIEELYAWVCGSYIFDIGWTHLVFIFYVSNSTELYLTFSYLYTTNILPIQLCIQTIHTKIKWFLGPRTRDDVNRCT